jgi:hypothetical protein
MTWQSTVRVRAGSKALRRQSALIANVQVPCLQSLVHCLWRRLGSARGSDERCLLSGCKCRSGCAASVWGPLDVPSEGPCAACEGALGARWALHKGKVPEGVDAHCFAYSTAAAAPGPQKACAAP